MPGSDNDDYKVSSDEENNSNNYVAFPENHTVSPVQDWGQTKNKKKKPCFTPNRIAIAVTLGVEITASALMTLFLSPKFKQWLDKQTETHHASHWGLFAFTLFSSVCMLLSAINLGSRKSNIDAFNNPTSRGCQRFCQQTGDFFKGLIKGGYNQLFLAGVASMAIGMTLSLLGAFHEMGVQSEASMPAPIQNMILPCAIFVLVHMLLFPMIQLALRCHATSQETELQKKASRGSDSSGGFHDAVGRPSTRMGERELKGNLTLD